MNALGRIAGRFLVLVPGLLATGQSSLCDTWGDPRPDFALADLLGAHLPAGHGARQEAIRRQWAAETAHSYLRLTPELRAGTDGPPAADGTPFCAASTRPTFCPSAAPWSRCSSIHRRRCC
jgi:hypothetical protein